MPTKSQLEKRIQRLEADIRERDKAIRILSNKNGMEITLPAVTQDMVSIDAPYFSSKESLSERLIKIMEPALRQHGVKLDYTSPAQSIRLHDNIHRVEGDRILVPIVWGEVMCSIIDAAAEFGRLCYREGVSDGTDMLVRMSKGELTAEDLEDGIEKALKRQERKDLSFKIKTSKL